MAWTSKQLIVAFYSNSTQLIVVFDSNSIQLNVVCDGLLHSAIGTLWSILFFVIEF